MADRAKKFGLVDKGEEEEKMKVRAERFGAGGKAGVSKED